jgi:hypothetical protein
LAKVLAGQGRQTAAEGEGRASAEPLALGVGKAPPGCAEAVSRGPPGEPKAEAEAVAEPVREGKRAPMERVALVVKVCGEGEADTSE